MKNLLLLLSLFLFSTQSFAQFCPDGSLPIKAVSMDGSYYEFKCVGKQKKQKTSINYGTKRLFDFDTSWVLTTTGRIQGNNGLTCWFLSYYELIGTCNNGVNYSYCINDSASLCGSDGTSYNFLGGNSIRSSFGSYCRVNNDSSRSITCR